MPENNEPKRDREQDTYSSRTDQGAGNERQGTSGTSSDTQRQGSQSDKGMNKEEETKRTSGTSR